MNNDTVGTPDDMQDDEAMKEKLKNSLESDDNVKSDPFSTDALGDEPEEEDDSGAL